MNSSTSQIGNVAKSLVLIALIISSLPALVNGQDVFQAGASAIDISPALGEPIVGNWNSPPATHIHDPLHARTLVLDDGKDRIAFVIADNVGIAQEVFDAAKRIIEKETGLAFSNILMSATHTHSGTSAGKKGQKRKGYNVDEELDDYQAFLARRISEGVRIAINNLEPAKIGWGSVDVPDHVFNRRWIMKEPVISPLGFMDIAKMNPGNMNPDLVEPAGPIDPEVSFISVQSKSGRPISVLANYSLHYVGGVPAGHISADYFAIFADRIQQLLSADRQYPPFVGIMSNGTSGDINNLNFAKPREKHLPYGKMTIVGNDVAVKVHVAMQEIEYLDYVDLSSASSTLTLDVRRASNELLANIAKVDANTDEDKPVFRSLEKNYSRNIKQLEADWPDQIDIQLQTIKIGNWAVAAIPFETFAEIGLEIKEKSPFDETFTIALANGIYGYLPSPAQHKKGGYETWLSTNKVEVGASDKIIAELMNLFSSIKK